MFVDVIVEVFSSSVIAAIARIGETRVQSAKHLMVAAKMLETALCGEGMRR